MAKKIRILVFTTAYRPMIGGSEIALEEMVRHLPDIFFAIRPPIVPEVLGKISVIYLIAAALITPVKILKRKLMEIKI